VTACFSPTYLGPECLTFRHLDTFVLVVVAIAIYYYCTAKLLCIKLPVLSNNGKWPRYNQCK